MKKKIKSILLVCLAVFTCLSLLSLSVKADSGWDTDYGGWDSSDSDWDSSDWGSSSSSGGSGSIGSLIVFVIIIIIVIVITNKGNKAKLDNSTIPIPSNIAINKLSVSDETLAKYNLNREELLNKAFELYKNVQISWMNIDYDSLRKYLSDELFNTYKMQLEALKMKKQKNVMEGFVRKDMVITDIFENNGLITATVELVVSQLDYVVNETNQVVKGTNTRRMMVHYELTFTMTLDKNSGKCPNCNAPLPNQASNKCPYCGSTVVTKNHDLVMTKKQNKGQYWE